MKSKLLLTFILCYVSSHTYSFPALSFCIYTHTRLSVFLYIYIYMHRNTYTHFPSSFMIIFTSVLCMVNKWTKLCKNESNTDISFNKYIYKLHKNILKYMSKIYSMKLPLTSITVSRRLWNLVQFFCMVCLLKLNATVLFAFSSPLVSEGVLLVFHSTAPHT